MLLSVPAGARGESVAVVPILIGPLQVLLAILPAILISVGGMILALLKPSAIKPGLKVLWRNRLSTVIAVGVIVGVVYLLSFLLGGGGAQASAMDRGEEDWPAFRGGIDRRGAAPSGDDPTRGGINWAFDREAKTFYSSPAVVGNLVYVCSAEVGIFGGSGAVYCLDAENGAVVWKYAPSNFRPTFSSPSVAGKYVVSGEGLHLTRDARITCLTADEGELVWEHRTASHVESSPCIYNGRAYIGAGDDGLYCIALKPGPGGKPKVLWHLDGGEYPDCETSPIAHEGKVYFGLGEGGAAVCCVDAETGEEIWRTPTPYPAFGSPAIAGGKLFVAMGNGNMVESAEVVRERQLQHLAEEGASQAEIDAARERLGPAGEIWALDPATGRRLWRYKLERTVLGTIAVADERLYFGCRDGTFYCLSADGELIGRWDAHEPILTSPAVGKDHVYFVTEPGRLYCLERQSLRPAWEVTVGTGGRCLSSPTVGRGHVYVGTEDNGLVCAGRPAGRKRKPVWAGHLGGPGRSGWTDASPLPAVGSFAWRYPKEDGASAVMHAPAAYLNGALYVGFAGADRTGLAKLALPDDPRKNRRAPPEEAWFYPLANAAYCSAAVTADRVYVLDGRAGDTGRHLHCVDAASGRGVWKRKVARDAPAHVLLTSDRLLAFEAADRLSCIRLTGGNVPELAWSQSVQAPVGSPAEAAGLVLVCTKSPPGLVAMDLARGEMRWRASLPAAPTTGPAATGDLIAVGTSEGLAVLSIVDGSQLWSVRCGPVKGPVVFDENRLACTTGSGEIVVMNWTGEQVVRVSGASGEGSTAADKPPIPGMPPMLCGRQMLYCSPKALVRVELPSGKLFRWRDTAWMGDITAPPIVVDSRAYFGTRGRGLVCVGPARK